MTRNVTRAPLLAFAALSLAGCINLQGSYDSAARDDCHDIIGADERRACLDAVERNSSERETTP